jgi:hypothetical protein
VQGAVLSATLFLISMSQINKNVDSPTKIIGSTDDWMIYIRLHSLQTAQTNIQAAVDKISSWARNIGFLISPEKTINQNHSINTSKNIRWQKIGASIQSQNIGGVFGQLTELGTLHFRS